MDRVNEKIITFLKNPMCPKINYEIGCLSYEVGYMSQALTFLMRCTDLTEDKKMLSECFLLCSKVYCFQGNGDAFEYDAILKSLSYGLDYPEVHYIKSLYHSWRGEWEACYNTCFMAINVLKNYEPCFTPNLFSYHGKNSLMRQYELSKFKTRRYKYLTNSSDNTLFYRNSLIKLDYNYSEILQDIFVEKISKGKRNGTFLEIGANDYMLHNNTFLLEKKYDWTGVSIEIDSKYENEWKKNRPNSTFIVANALEVDYNSILPNVPYIDYLQLDCDPSAITYDIMLKIPFNSFKFKIITFEHDAYRGEEGECIRILSRNFLKSKGYVMVAGNISADYTLHHVCEDWWVHPELVEDYKKYVRDSDTPTSAANYIFEAFGSLFN